MHHVSANDRPKLSHVNTLSAHASAPVLVPLASPVLVPLASPALASPVAPIDVGTSPEPDAEKAKALMEAAHQVCPYSNATRGNIEVELAVA